MVEEYHKLDAEDYVGGVPTRFRYREVRQHLERLCSPIPLLLILLY